MRTLFCTSFSFLTQGVNLSQTTVAARVFDANFKENHSCAECFAHVFSQTANRSSLDIIDQTNQFRSVYKCVFSFYTSFRSKCENILWGCCFVLLFTQKTPISSISLLRTLFCTKIANLKMSPRFWPNKPIYENLYKNNKFQDVCMFLT